ncbi:MAG: hypothetical protein M5U09_18690 [Gammaproteobacteria bacterium]|nr:hypothetical protein [Gammaproteobacteria bacterium]
MTKTGGAMNLQDGALTVEVSRPASDSTIARMIRLVEEAEANRAEDAGLHRLVRRALHRGGDRRRGAGLLAFRYAVAMPFDRALYRAMTLLVVASPCALVLATPAALLAAIATAARHGILVKGGGVFEQVAAAKVVVFDKTGTLTLGEPRVEGSDSGQRHAAGRDRPAGRQRRAYLGASGGGGDRP